jgi:hypothetical protein
MNEGTENYLLTYQKAQGYLMLSSVYANYLGGLRWSGQEDALVDASNRTFAFSEQIAEFLEGFASEGRVVAFHYLLHWVDLLTVERATTTPSIQQLQKVFANTGRNWRFAGALAAKFCDSVPEAPDPPDLGAVGKRLRNRAFPIRWFTSQFHETQYPPVQPPIAPAAFEAEMVRRLEAYSEADLRTWLRTGRGPIKDAERLAEEPPTPRSLARVLAELVQRPRLSGAQTYVTQLVGALALPPRRFVPQELPIGGYSDIVTRGEVEHLLPTQFALDELEFLRRFAEKELLFFRREEPPAQNRQELVVLLDQGVRTWGDVRLVLSAAALAFGKQAIARKTPFFLATTGNHGKVVEPTGEDGEALGQLVEASDLSLNPGLALEQTLETPSEALRDVVLLTHPRNLREEDVLSAARRVGVNDRLFAVALDAHGQVEVSEIRRGTPIKVRQFHVDFAPSQPKPRPKPASDAPGTPWTGDVETIPYPFRLGTEPHVTHLDFDYGGEWLLTVSGQRLLHLWKLDGLAQEMLPAPYRDPKLGPVGTVLGVIGVLAGFVLAVRCNGRLVLAHYDLARRHCRLLALDPYPYDKANLYYQRDTHCVLVLDMYRRATKTVDLRLDHLHVAPILDASATALDEKPLSNRQLPAFNRELPWFNYSPGREYYPPGWTDQAYGEYDGITGKLIVHQSMGGPSRTIMPIMDGARCLKHSALHNLQLAGDIVAMRVKRQDIGECITLARSSDGAIVREYPVVRNKHKIARHLLSFDGSRIALLRSDHRVEVEPVSDSSLPSLTTRVGGFTMEALLYVGTHCVLLNLGSSRQFWHLFDWAGGKLEHHYLRTPIRHDERRGTPAFPIKGSRTPYKPGGTELWPGCGLQDRGRFLECVQRGLWFVLDRFGQVAILDQGEQVLAMFVAFRDRHAAWMPDGTRCGSLTLSLGHATPDAAEKIGRALLIAEKAEEIA